MANEENLRPNVFTSENQPPAASKSRKGIPNRATVFERLLKIRIKVPDPKDPKNKNKKLTVSLHEAMALGQIQSAMKGNTRAFQEIQDSLFGKLTEKIDANLSGNLDMNIQAAIAEVYGSAKESDGEGSTDDSDD